MIQKGDFAPFFKCKFELLNNLFCGIALIDLVKNLLLFDY
ncbi:very hypothetical protein [Metamycoplasma arthritidis 158L3-1]|uniref:Uncharacterized protein n=1 Tax=Metamycoplasma arthritidis (strain 158L3-1) TaxID=243272 RepID=B3PN33_META1|nr:very hypothetical protein [Metamycoplasma arthritidis 158L3-1]